MSGKRFEFAAVNCTPQTKEDFWAMMRGWNCAAAKVLLVLLMEPKGMTAVELEREVGHSDKPVRQMLREM